MGRSSVSFDMGARKWLAVLAFGCIASVQAQFGPRVQPRLPRPVGPLSASAADAVVKNLQSVRMQSALWTPNLESIRKALVANSAGLVSMISGTNQSDSSEAIYEAGARRDTSTVPALSRVTHRGSTALQIAAVSALKSIGNRPATSVLREAVKNPTHSVAVEASMCLAELGDPTGKSILIRELPDPKTLGVGWIFEKDRRRIAHDLVLLGFGSRPGELHALLATKNSEVRYLLPELAMKAWPGTRHELRRILLDQKEYQGNRKWAAIGLGDARIREAVPDLILALKDPVADVRGSAAEALGKIGDRSAIPALRAIAANVVRDRYPFDPRQRAKMAAVDALELLSRR